MKMMIAESEFRPVMVAVYERLEKLSSKKKIDEETLNLYRVLHRYRSEEGEEEYIPEVITHDNIKTLLEEVKELKK